MNKIRDLFDPITYITYFYRESAFVFAMPTKRIHWPDSPRRYRHAQTRISPSGETAGTCSSELTYHSRFPRLSPPDGTFIGLGHVRDLHFKSCPSRGRLNTVKRKNERINGDLLFECFARTRRTCNGRVRVRVRRKAVSIDKKRTAAVDK